MSKDATIVRITAHDLASDQEIEQAAKDAGADPKGVKATLGELFRDKSMLVSTTEGDSIEIKIDVAAGLDTSEMAIATVGNMLATVLDVLSHTDLTVADVVERLPESERSEELIDALLPPGIPTAPQVLQLRRNAEARRQLLEESGALTSAQVADLAGSQSSNRAALANRWRSEGRVFAVRRGDQLVYPAFQFSAEGQPKAVIAEVLRALREDPTITDWQVALWFTANVGGLSGERPVDAMDKHPDRVIEAARREGAEFVT